MMGEDLLKKIGAGNLFTVFGEPDVNIKEEQGELVVELARGGRVRPHNWRGAIELHRRHCLLVHRHELQPESFFVRHAHFTGGDEPYERLQRTLRAEIDEEARQSLYSTVSRLLPKPETGRIAVKVIDHYGDEVLEVYEV